MFVLPWNKNALLALCSPDTCVTPRVVFTRSSSVMISICKSGSIPNPTAVGGAERESWINFYFKSGNGKNGEKYLVQTFPVPSQTLYTVITYKTVTLLQEREDTLLQFFQLNDFHRFYYTQVKTFYN